MESHHEIHKRRVFHIKSFHSKSDLEPKFHDRFPSELDSLQFCFSIPFNRRDSSPIHVIHSPIYHDANFVQLIAILLQFIAVHRDSIILQFINHAKEKSMDSILMWGRRIFRFRSIIIGRGS